MKVSTAVVVIAVAAGLFWLANEERARRQNEDARDFAQFEAESARRIAKGPSVVSASRIDGGVVQIIEVPTRSILSDVEVTSCVLFIGDKGSSAMSCNKQMSLY